MSCHSFAGGMESYCGQGDRIRASSSCCFSTRWKVDLIRWFPSSDRNERGRDRLHKYDKSSSGEIDRNDGEFQNRTIDEEES